MHPSLYEFLKLNQSSSLLFIDPVARKTATWEEVIQPLPVAPDQSKSLAFLYLDNSLQSVSTFLSFLSTTHALCMLSADLHLELKNKLEEVYKPAFIFDKTRLNCTTDHIWSKNGFSLYVNKQKNYPIHPDLKILLATSGTTGSLKFVKLTSANFIANIQSILDYLPIAATDSCPLNLPIHYSYGLSVLLTNIVRGGQILCTNEAVLSRNFWTEFKEYGCTSLAGVPYTYEMLNRIGFSKMEDLKIRYLSQAGGKLDEKTLLFMSEYSKSRGFPFFVMYGQTEATARMSYLPPENLEEKSGSIGKPILNGSFSIDKESAELIYKGPNIGCGYAENMSDLESCDPLAELHTGDMAKKDADGFYYISGRLKRFMKLFGNRINLDELEHDLKHQFKSFIGCTGLDDKALLVFSDSAQLQGKEIQNYLFDTYKIHPSVIKYVWFEKIPLTASHKINYQTILSTYES